MHFFHEPETEISGDARNDIANDKTLLGKQKIAVAKIMADSHYGREDFSENAVWALHLEKWEIIIC